MRNEPKLRQRNTASVQRRAENMRRLLARLEEGPMDANQIAEFLGGFSASGTRKYIRDLRDSSVIEVSHLYGGYGKFAGYQAWKLTDKMDSRAAFLESLNVPASGRGPAKKSVPASSDPTRHFHVMRDDVHYAIRVSRTPVRRDDLVSALFGPAKAESEQT